MKLERFGEENLKEIGLMVKGNELLGGDTGYRRRQIGLADWFFEVLECASARGSIR